MYELAETLRDRLKNIWRRGSQAWGKRGVGVSLTGGTYATLYFGEIFQAGVAALIPKNPAHIPAIWAYISSSEYLSEVKKVDRRLGLSLIHISEPTRPY